MCIHTVQAGGLSHVPHGEALAAPFREAGQPLRVPLPCRFLSTLKRTSEGLARWKPKRPSAILQAVWEAQELLQKGPLPQPPGIQTGSSMICLCTRGLADPAVKAAGGEL